MPWRATTQPRLLGTTALEIIVVSEYKTTENRDTGAAIAEHRKRFTRVTVNFDAGDQDVLSRCWRNGLRGHPVNAVGNGEAKYFVTKGPVVTAHGAAAADIANFDPVRAICGVLAL